ncbi:putative membrane protein [Providencia alcalifaciens]|nr:putative membrane protein [Providencia alcalifaciens]
MHLRANIRQLAAYLALLAIAMLFIAPLASKSMMQMADCIPMNDMAEYSMHQHHDMALSEKCHSSGTMNHMFMSGMGLSPMEDIACGYCQLLVHFPFIILFIAFIIRQLAILTTCLPFERCIRISLFHPWSLRFARAPPSDFSL